MNDQSNFDEIVNDVEALLRQAPLRAPGPRLDTRVMQALRRGWWNQISRRARLGAWSVAAFASMLKSRSNSPEQAISADFSMP